MGEPDQSDIQNDIDDILKAVVKSKNLTNYELKPNLNAQVGDGFVGQFYTAEIVDRDSGETISVAIKRASKIDWDFVFIFKNEATLYFRLFPALDSLQRKCNLAKPFDNIPELYSYGLEPKKEYLAMENLKTKGFVLLDKKAYLDKEHLEFLFKLYGRFHALSFVLRKQNIDDYNEIHKEYSDIFYVFVDFAMEQIRASVAGAIDALDSTSAVYDAAQVLLDNIKDIFVKQAIYTGGYRCSTHGDCWSNNMMFKYSDSGKLEDVKLLDFQLARDGSLIHDLSYFFYSGACKTDLDGIEYYLKIYHKSLSEVISQLGEDAEELFSYDTLIQEWKDNALFGIIMAVYLWQVKLLPREECVDYLKDAENSTIESKSEHFLQLFVKTAKSDAFRERTSALLNHAYEFGVLRKEKLMVKN